MAVQLFEELRKRIRRECQDEDGTYWTDDELDAYIAEAQNDFCERTECLKTNAMIPSAQDGFVYNLPDDCIELNRVTDEDDAILGIVRADELEGELGGNASDFSATGDPQYAVIGLDDPNQFRLYPRPSSSALPDRSTFTGLWHEVADINVRGSAFYDCRGLYSDDNWLFAGFSYYKAFAVRRQDWTLRKGGLATSFYDETGTVYGGPLVNAESSPINIYRVGAVGKDGSIRQTSNVDGSVTAAANAMIEGLSIGGGYRYYGVNLTVGDDVTYRADELVEASPVEITFDGNSELAKYIAYHRQTDVVAFAVDVGGVGTPNIEVYADDYDDTTPDLVIDPVNGMDHVLGLFYDMDANLYLVGNDPR